jgi:hypothetical protein
LGLAFLQFRGQKSGKKRRHLGLNSINNRYGILIIALHLSLGLNSRLTIEYTFKTQDIVVIGISAALYCIWVQRQAGVFDVGFLPAGYLAIFAIIWSVGDGGLGAQSASS